MSSATVRRHHHHHQEDSHNHDPDQHHNHHHHHHTFTMRNCITIFVLLFASFLPSTRGLSCLPCREVTCELPAAVTRCPWGLVFDMCGCCYVCGKGPGETCGGQWAWHGRCGFSLDCLKPHEVGGNRGRQRASSGGGNALALLNMEEPARCYRRRDTVADSISTFFAWFSSLFRNGPRDD